MDLTDDMVAMLENALQADSSGDLHREVLRSLGRLESRLAREAHKLLRPQDYRTLEAVADAVQAARHVMALYQSAHS